METKTKIIIASVAVLTAFAVGRWSAPEKVRIETKTVEVEKKTTDTDTGRNKHKETTTVEKELPDGTKEKTTTTVEDTNTERKTTSTDDKSVTQETTKEITNSSSKVTISVLGGVNVTAPTNPPVYGGAVTRPILGPITVGIWGLSSGVGGASVGLTF